MIRSINAVAAGSNEHRSTRGPWLPIVLTLLFVLALLAPPCLAGTVRQITDQRTTVPAWTATNLATNMYPLMPSTSLDDVGSSVFLNATTNQLGGNPEHRYQIFRFDADTGTGQQVTNFPKGVSDLPGTVSVSDDGQWLAFVSRSDPVGQNHDASPELFVMRSDGAGITQRTSDPAVNAGSVYAAVLSGSANRILFLSNTNPLGSNPSNLIQLFVVDFAGTGLRQLTAATTSSRWSGIGISDDGQKVIFSTTANLTGGNADLSNEVFAIMSDGTGLRQLTSASGYGSQLPVISGNGAEVAFESTANFTGQNSFGYPVIYTINWDGTGLIQITSGTSFAFQPSITDDGQFVYYVHDNIYKVKTDNTGRSQISFLSPDKVYQPVVAGGGGRIVFVKDHPHPPTNDVSEGAPDEIDVMTTSGANAHPLVAKTMAACLDPEITRDGTRIVVISKMNPFGTNVDGGYEVFRMETDGSGLAQVTNFPAANTLSPSIAADRSTIVFASSADPLGQNPDGSQEIFLIQADGTGLRQLTSNSDPNNSPGAPRISANGSVVVFSTVFNNGSYVEIAKVNSDGTGLLYLTSALRTSYGQRIDDTGTWVTFHSTGNLDGTAPNGALQIWRIRTDGTGLRRLSTDATRNDFDPDISGSGSRVVYISQADPLGTNPTHRREVFLFDATTNLTRQLSATPVPAGSAFDASISGDGNVVYFSATSPYDENDPNLYADIFRVPAAGGPVARIGALTPSEIGYRDAPRSDMTGSKFVFGSADDTTEQNPDRSWEIWVGSMAREPEIRVGRSAPTLVSWDHETGPLRYDVIRGDVQNLAPGPPGTVDLGPVACLENDSPDADIRGFEDAGVPLVGHAFFFLFRGSRGLNYGPGSWGQSSSGAERIPGSGTCAP